jgi:hypothetical protein
MTLAESEQDATIVRKMKRSRDGGSIMEQPRKY